MKKKVLSTLLALTMTASVLTACGSSDSTNTETTTETTEEAAEETAETTEEAEATEETAEAETDVEKPEKITMMVDGTLVTQENGRDEFEAAWEALTGIDLEINQPDHDAYYDQVGQVFASGDLPDVILLDSTRYTSYASMGVLADITDIYEGSDLQARVSAAGNDALIEGIKIDGRLYGFTPTRGNGCVTYVKKAWLDNCGLEAPTTYDEYVAMLEAFTTGDPDGNGVDGDTYGVSAAGFIGGEAPYVNYLPEFYQDAYPGFYQKEDGTWADGFTEDAMKEALQRIADANAAGIIDPETLTNGTSDCRNKFYEDKFGVFTYWAGTWATNLKTNLEANGLDGELVALEPIAEVGNYIERIAPVWCITASCSNVEGVYKYFIETMLDGGDVQMLWQYGVEGVHWSTAAEEVCGNTYAEGEFHMLENLEKEGTQYTKNHLDPNLVLAPLDNDPGAAAIADENKASAETFAANSVVADLPISTDAMQQYNGDLTTLKNELVANVAQGKITVDEAYAQFESEGGAEWSQAIVDSLNQ